MYRSRPKGSLDDEVLDFLSSTGSDRLILEYDILGSEAHSIMLHEAGILSRPELGKILSALELARKNPSLVSPDGFEDVHEALEAFVIKKAGMDSGGKMHSARSRNDQVALDTRMKLRDDINGVCAGLADLIDSLLAQARGAVSVPMPMYTHLQQGQIGTFSHYLLSYSYSLMRDMERLYLCYQRVNQSPLGACAIGGSSLPIDRKRTAVLLGFDSLVVNSIDATSSRDVMLEFISALGIMALSLSRIAEDFIIWCTSEFDYLELDDRFSSTSSAMPQKKNPDPLELVRAKTAVVVGNMVAGMGIVKGLPTGYSRDLQEVKPLLFETAALSLAILKVMSGAVRSLKVKQDKMRAAASSSYAVSLDIAEQLVTRHGIPFREAHKIVGGLVQKAADSGLTLAQLAEKDVAMAIKKMNTKLDAGELRSIIIEMTPEKAVASRKSAGSPSPAEQREMIKALAQSIRNYRQGVERRARMVNGAFGNLGREVAKYLQT